MPRIIFSLNMSHAIFVTQKVYLLFIGNSNFIEQLVLFLAILYSFKSSIAFRDFLCSKLQVETLPPRVHSKAKEKRCLPGLPRGLWLGPRLSAKVTRGPPPFAWRLRFALQWEVVLLWTYPLLFFFGRG